MKTQILYYLVLCSLFQLAYAGNYDLLEVTNTDDMRPSIFSIRTDHNEDIVSFKNKKPDKRPDIFLAKRLKGGFLIDNTDGNEVVYLRSDNFVQEEGGDLTLDYLYDGWEEERREFVFQIIRSDDQWALCHDGKELSRLHFELHKGMILGVVGILEVVPHYKEQPVPDQDSPEEEATPNICAGTELTADDREEEED